MNIVSAQSSLCQFEYNNETLTIQKALLLSKNCNLNVEVIITWDIKDVGWYICTINVQNTVSWYEH